VLALAVTIVAIQHSGTADANPLGGKWKQGALKEEFTVQQWLAGCGPAPTNSSSGGGEIVTINEEGDELSFVGGGRVYKTNQCYDPLPTLSRTAHSHDPTARTWRTRCETPASDPRRATINTLVAATSDSHIDVVETGRYEITLSDGKCLADIKRSRSFDLVQSDAPPPTVTATTPPPPTNTTPPPPPPKQCTSPGDPARLEVRPSRKLIKPGESFAFRAVVLDGEGCATKTTTTWAGGDPAKKITVDDTGKVTVAPDAPEGTTEITVTAAGKTAKVTIEVASAGHYDDLLAQSGLNASGESDTASTTVIASSSLGAGDAKAEDSGKKRRNIFIAVVGGLALVLGILAIVGVRRSRKAAALEREAAERHEERLREYEDKKRQKQAEYEAQMKAHEESVAAVEAAKAKRAAAVASTNGLECPSCRREFPSTSQFCPHDGNRLVPRKGNAGPLGVVCPTCKRGYDAGTKVCPADGDELVPYAMYAATAQPPPKAKGKICPTCGGRFDGEAGFCGKDGTALVLMN
jgi:DNA-directed RNA polymerase subunit M/transcription elongation factor TFIIS